MLDAILCKGRAIRQHTTCVVLNIHFAHIVTREVNLEVLEWLCRYGEVAIHIWRAEHILCRCCGLAPLLRCGVAAALQGYACRSLNPRSISNLTLQVQAHNCCARAIVALVDSCTILAHETCLTQSKHAIEHCAEALDEEVGLHTTKGLIHIGRNGERV